MSDEMVKAGVDAAGLLVVVGTLAEWLPAVSAALSATWFAIRIVEWLRS